MIGVAFHPDRRHLANELFQLFKTPWEPLRENHTYSAVIAFGMEPPIRGAKLTIVSVDETPGAGDEYPLVQEDSDGHLRATLGVDLLRVLESLLVRGQGSDHAQLPLMEHHIQNIREVLELGGVPYVEIPPIPYGHTFTVCLTHDVDFIGIRQHILDRTFFGYVYRATGGSLLSFIRGRLRMSDLIRNVLSVISLPLVYLGLLPDFMNRFLEYLSVDGEGASTFYLVPFRDRSGKTSDGTMPRERAVKYDVTRIGETLDQLRSQGTEIGVHGIDAWIDSQAGAVEIERVCPGTISSGVRMHWLLSDAGTPRRLEDAGFGYDSTVGYNDAVGFRAGTAQAFCPPGCLRLLELPLILQDTALFYPARMNLSEADAWGTIETIVESIERFGGVLVINWHQRSLGPERLWGRFYRRLVNHLRNRGAWFTTARNAVDWFAARRALSFDTNAGRSTEPVVSVCGSWPRSLPVPVVRQSGAVQLDRGCLGGSSQVAASIGPGGQV
jgi:hypothetical protein